jgi:nucleoside diphosphate kinase
VKILVLGATGMLGHKAMQVLSGRHEVVGSVRRDPAGYRDHPVLKGLALVGDVDVNDFSTVERAVDTVGPDLVINCIGIVKQLKEAHDPVPSIAINALFPHLLAQLCVRRGMRMVHMSKREAEGFYAVHRERPFFGGLTDFMSSGPGVLLALEAPDAIKKWRTLMGATDPAKADAATLRKDFGSSIERNATHGSDAADTAAFELGYFFRGMELL